MYLAITALPIALFLVISYLCFAYYNELKWAEDEIRALRKTIDAMNDNRSLRPSTPRRSETLILRK